MGKTRTSKYRVEMRFVNFAARRPDTFVTGWDVTRHGRPTVENAKKYRDGYNQSMEPGGVNAHLRSGQSNFGRTTIIRQKDGEVMAEFVPPAFEVVAESPNA
jgi:hypothetical protein